MIIKKLGNTDILLSVIGLGTWAIGGAYEFGWGPQDDEDSIATIYRALELGINWIDTAPVYGLGHSEEIIGRTLNGIRDKVFISTKCGIRWDDKGNLFYSLKKKSIRSELEDSLRRLNIDMIDLYQLHVPLPDEEIEEGWNELALLVKEGKIRYAGVSNFNVDQLKRIQSLHPVSFLQSHYNFVDLSIEGDVINYCKENNIGIMAFSPMGRGLLTGKFNKEKIKALPTDDHRLKLPFFQEPELSANLQLVELLKPIAEKNGHSIAQLAIAWTLRHPGVTSAIVGARKPPQIEQTLPAGDWIISEKDQAEIDSILTEHHVRLKQLKIKDKKDNQHKFQLNLSNSTSPEYDTDYAIEINGMTAKNILMLYFSYNHKEYEPTRINSFIQCYKSNLQSIIRHCLEKKKEISKLNLSAIEYHIKKDYEVYLDTIKKEKLPDPAAKNDSRHILLTGGAGFLGSYLVAEFLEKTQATLYLLIRGQSQENAEERLKNKMIFYFGQDFFDHFKKRLVIIRSDLRSPRLGIDDDYYSQLTQVIELIVHPAANVKHFGLYEELYKDNVEGTEHLLEFAITGKKKDFHYVSTLDVGRGDIPGREYCLFTEYCHDLGQKIDHIYLKTKLTAENRVLDYRQKGINGSIYRVGNLVFHSDSGKFQENIADDYFYAIIRGTIKLKMMTPGMRQIVFDMSFINYIARAIVLLVTSRDLCNQTYHLCNPNRFPMTDLEMFLKDLNIHLNQVEENQINEYLEKFEGDREFEKIIERMRLHAWAFHEKLGTETVFKIDRTVQLLKHFGFVWPKVTATHVDRMITHCKNVGFL